jgi:hypothetical protein
VAKADHEASRMLSHAGDLGHRPAERVSQASDLVLDLNEAMRRRHWPQRALRCALWDAVVIEEVGEDAGPHCGHGARTARR